jgi:hypothetical protein
MSLIESDIAAKLKALSKTKQRHFLSLHNNFPSKHPFSGIVKTNALPCGPDSAIAESTLKFALSTTAVSLMLIIARTVMQSAKPSTQSALSKPGRGHHLLRQGRSVWLWARLSKNRVRLRLQLQSLHPSTSRSLSKRRSPPLDPAPRRSSWESRASDEEPRRESGRLPPFASGSQRGVQEQC